MPILQGKNVRSMMRCAVVLTVVATSSAFIGCTKIDNQTSPPANNQATSAPKIENPASTNNDVSSASAVSSTSMVIATSQPVATFDSNGNFSETGKLSATRTSHTATLLKNGQVLIVGGSGHDGMGEDGGAGSYVSRVFAELYDPKTGKFDNTGKLIAARSFHTATLLPNGLVLIVGGMKSYGEASASAEIYDPATGKFKATGNLNKARSSHTATLLPNGKVLIAGGAGDRIKGEPNVLASAEIYDPVSNRFTLLPFSLVTARSAHNATQLTNGKVLFTGGMGKGHNNFLDRAELYDPVSGEFTSAGNLNSARVDHTATVLKNSNVLIVGGVAGFWQNFTLNSAELYNPDTNAFSKVANLNVERSGHTSTLLPNGRVLIVAGSDRHGATQEVELYDPSTDTFTSIENIPAHSRKNHTATLLQDGRVLIVGGDDYDYAFDDAVLYESGSTNAPPDNFPQNRDTPNTATPATNSPAE